jgi:hypothetical protein
MMQLLVDACIKSHRSPITNASRVSIYSNLKMEYVTYVNYTNSTIQLCDSDKGYKIKG